MTIEQIRPIAVDLFSGVGGLSLGAEWAGFRTALHVEIEEIAGRYGHFNFPLSKHLYGDPEGDVRNLNAEKIYNITGVRNIDLIMGGPPCQGFSTIGRSRVDDPLNDLVLEMARIIIEVMPKGFIIENVPGSKRGRYWQFDKAIDRLGEHYNISKPTTIHAADFGIPQTRKRVFTIGIRNDLEKSPTIPTPTHSAKPSIEIFSPCPTAWQAISDLPDCDMYDHLIDFDSVEYTQLPDSDYSISMRRIDLHSEKRGYIVEWEDKLCTNLRRTLHGDSLVRRLRDTPQGQTEKVSTTIRAGTTSSRGAWSAPRPCHPYLDRVLTSRECARIQSFPDWFRFHPAKWHGNRQIGNAVPPLMAKAICGNLLRDLGIEIPKQKQATLVLRDYELIREDLAELELARLSNKKMSHKVEGTGADSRRRVA